MIRRAITNAAWIALLLSGRAVADSTHLPRPPELPIDRDPKHGNLIILKLRLETGETWPFMLDTGSPMTVLDKSLQSKLGKPVGRMPMGLVGHKFRKSNLYAAPKLYLGDTALVTGTNVGVFPLNRNFRGLTGMTNDPPPYHLGGFLGMDCLRHYCIQFDFEARKLRFLDPDEACGPGLGRAFPITLSQVGPGKKFISPMVHHSGFVGQSTNLMIDTGCGIDGLVERGLFKQSRALLPRCIWEGQTYTNIILAPVGQSVLGLRFLARHLVTLNFPRQTMYLKPTRAGPPDDDVYLERSKRLPVLPP